MNYHEYEMLAKYKKREFEEISKEFSLLLAIKHESMLQKVVMNLVEKLKSNKSESKDPCCTTQCCTA